MPKVFLRGKLEPIIIKKEEADHLKMCLSNKIESVELGENWFKTNEVRAIEGDDKREQDEEKRLFYEGIYLNWVKSMKAAQMWSPERKIDDELSGRIKILWKIVCEKEMSQEIKDDIRAKGLKFFEQNPERVFIGAEIIKNYFLENFQEGITDFKNTLKARGIACLLSAVYGAEEEFLRRNGYSKMEKEAPSPAAPNEIDPDKIPF